MGKSPIGYEQAADWIRGNGSTVKEHFKNYFDKRVGENAKHVWHGQHFEWFANRVARDCFTEIDLAAIGALSVDLPAQTARELLEDHDGMLRQLLMECELWTTTYGADVSDPDLSSIWLEKGSCFRRLWDELVKRERIGLGTVKASKIMAAKYPGLVPIFDNQVSWLLGLTENGPWWKPMRDLVIEVKPDLKELNLDRNDVHITTIRKLDVVLWMEAERRLKSK